MAGKDTIGVAGEHSGDYGLTVNLRQAVFYAIGREGLCRILGPQFRSATARIFRLRVRRR